MSEGNMVERVARAIAASDEANPPIACACSGKESPEDFACPCAMYASRRRAVAAIEAMREPTEAMLEYEIDQHDLHNTVKTDGELIWRAMIDAALSGKG